MDNSYLNTSVTPMEVDTTQEHDKSIKKQENLNVELSFRGRRRIMRRRKKSEDLSENERKKQPSRLNFIMLATFLGLFLLFVQHYDQYFYNRTINITQIEFDLNAKLINQDEPIRQVLNALKHINNKNQLNNINLIVLMGGMGVGKTFTIEIIKDAFKLSQTIFIDMHLFNKTTDLNLYRTVPYLVIADDLKQHHIANFKDFIDNLPKNKSILILSALNVQTTGDLLNYQINYENYDLLSNIFDEFNCKVTVIRFNKINKQNALDFYKNNEHICDKMIKLIEGYDFEQFGFKGLYAKLNLVNCNEE